ncbi:MAG: hypothetical protein QOE44_590 [Solirubrobacteraceae bacterium]|jgi:GT2 family glycosyltransferase|nr:hypothetical protein [Solirubrobacteraceae bacterium]
MGPIHGRVTAAVLTYDGRDLLEGMLPSLAAQDLDELEVVIVDNGSTDGTADWLRETWPEFKVIRLEENRGVTAALNVCLGAGAGEFVALLNNDVELDPRCLGELRAALGACPQAGVAAAKLIQFDRRDHLDGTGDLYFWGGEAQRRGQGELDLGQYEDAEDVFGASGAVALYRRSAIAVVGDFDERFHALREDVDWSFRAQLAGFRCRYVPTAVAHHMGSATIGTGATDFVLYHNWRNGIWTIAKNYPIASLARHLPSILLVQARNLAIATRRHKAGLWFRAWRDALRGLPVMLRRRRGIQAARTATVRDLERAVAAGQPSRSRRPQLAMGGRRQLPPAGPERAQRGAPIVVAGGH